MTEPSGQPQAETDTGPLAPGTRVGDYEIQHLLGKGGMGWVYAAVHPLIGKRAAVKVLQPGLATSAQSVARFLAEARAANKIGHPGIIDIFAFGELPDRSPYFVMEHLQGESLRDRLRRGPVPPAEAREILAQLTDALAAAHQAGVVHRDLKPDNVFLCGGQGRGPRVKLLDFGIAKLTEQGVSTGMTQTGVPIGSPAYMSPEQCLGQTVDHRADLYATGVLLYEIFTGRIPFHAQTYMEMLVAQVNQPPPPPRQLASLPEELERLILWCLEKRPDGRPADVATLQAHLLPCLDRMAAPGGAAPFAATGAGPGYVGGPTPGYATGPAPGYAMGPTPGYATGPAPGYGTGPSGGTPTPQDPYAATVMATPGPGTPHPPLAPHGAAHPATPPPPALAQAGWPTPQGASAPGGPPGTPPPGPWPTPRGPGYPTPTQAVPPPGGPWPAPGTAPPRSKASFNVWIVLLVIGLLAAGIVALAVGLSKGDDSEGGSRGDKPAATDGPAVGARVLANWTKDPFWYPATVSEREGSRIKVRFDDGDSEWLPADRTAPLAFRVGERVQAKGVLGVYVWATVLRVESDRLFLQDLNSAQAWVPLSRVRTPREASLPVMGIPVD